MVIFISSRTLINKRPLSGQSIVTYLKISSKHYECNYSLIGHIPWSFAYQSINFLSNSFYN